MPSVNGRGFELMRVLCVRVLVVLIAATVVSAVGGAAAASAATGTVATTTKLTSSANPAGYGVTITLTATVSGCASPDPSGLQPSAPTGTVMFTDTTTGATFPEAELVPDPGACTGGSDTSSTAEVEVSFNKTGTHALKATFSPDETAPWRTSSGTLSETVKVLGVATTTKVTASPTPALVDQQVTLAAVVSGCGTVPGDESASPPSGAVTFTDTTTGDTLGTVDLVHDSPTGCVDRAAPNTSTARLTASFSSKGAHKITAQYVSSDQNAWLESQGSTTETINATGVTTTVKLRSDAVQPLNQETTLTAMVDGCGPNSLEPNGTVDFYDQTTKTDLGTADVNPASCDAPGFGPPTASLKTHFAKAGTNTIKLTFTSENQNDWLNSTSTKAITAKYIGVKTTVTLQTTGDEPLNKETTLTAMVEGCDPNNVEPFGTVDFYDQTTKIDLGTADVNPASCDATGFGPPTASLKTHFSKAGAHTIKLTFTSQDQNDWLNSTSSKAITAKYIGVKTSVTLQSPTTQPLNDSTTLTAVVDGCGPNNLEPFGTVDFYDTTTKTDLGTADVNPASCDATGFGPPTASLKTHFSKAGAHTIKLTFTSQDQNDWLNSTSSKAITAKYVGVKTTIKLASDDIQPLNTETTLTAVVEGCDRDNVEPFGTVDFYDTTTKTDLGTADVNPTFCTGPGFGEPTANLKTHFTKAGAHTIKLTFISQDQNDWLDSTGSGSVTVVAQQPT